MASTAGSTATTPESTSTIPANSWRHLPRTLIATGGRRTESDFITAIALGADGGAVANSAIQTIGCLGMRACESNNSPVGIATPSDDLRSRLMVAEAADTLKPFFDATVELISVIARGCGHDAFTDFKRQDLVTWQRDMAVLTWIEYAGVGRNETSHLAESDPEY